MQSLLSLLALFAALFGSSPNSSRVADTRFPLFAYLTGAPAARMVAYSPPDLDPRNPANQNRLRTSSIRADLEALRPVFDGLILYGYNEAVTPRILSVAKSLKYRAILLGVWDIKSSFELDGAAEIARLYEKDFALGVLVGNEGITFGRYEPEDLKIAAERIRKKLPASIPIATSEPLGGYEKDFVREFGDFMAPNIHPVFDRPNMNAEQGAAWAREEAEALVKKMGKPLLIKETGFPHDGKPLFTAQTQKDFWSAYLKPGVLKPVGEGGKTWAFFGVAFEAFDLLWKSEASGMPIERSWGLFSHDRKPYPALEVWKNR